jgi:hypothetical protein
MSAARAKQLRIVQGLASVVGLDPESADPYDVLKTVAETLGCSVGDDGTTALTEVIKVGASQLCEASPALKPLADPSNRCVQWLQEEAEPGGRTKKRRRGGATAAAAAAVEEPAGEEEEEDEDDEDEEGDEEEDEEGEEGGSQSSGSEPEEGMEDMGEEMEVRRAGRRGCGRANSGCASRRAGGGCGWLLPSTLACRAKPPGPPKINSGSSCDCSRLCFAPPSSTIQHCLCPALLLRRTLTLLWSQ